MVVCAILRFIGGGKGIFIHYKTGDRRDSGSVCLLCAVFLSEPRHDQLNHAHQLVVQSLSQEWRGSGQK